METNKNRFMNAEHVANELGISKPYAYKIIHRLNDELQEKGFMTIAGKVTRQYFEDRFFGNGAKEES